MTPPFDPDDPITAEHLEQALRFVYAMSMRTSFAADRVEALLMSMVKALIDGGAITRAAFDHALAQPTPAKPSTQPDVVVKLGPPTDKYTAETPADLDCAELLPLCKARCCRLTFPLSPQDLEQGRLSFDYRRPFHILQGPDGACVHQDRATGGCTVYEVRPATCRRYDCREDRRIWLDFERRIPAPVSLLAADRDMAPPDPT